MFMFVSTAMMNTYGYLTDDRWAKSYRLLMLEGVCGGLSGIHFILVTSLQRLCTMVSMWLTALMQVRFVLCECYILSAQLVD